MQRCPSCGEENGDRARFCSNCGAALGDAAAPAGEERKVVSVLFVDLVGFTARSDHADPEDVRATLRVYHDLLRREIERYGGTVEKFIGDAVMAVFGAPVAHEDDAERAVRSALRIVEAIDELNESRTGLDLAVRGAVNTGEAVVALGARPEVGEGFVTGDVVNVASRLQGAAPVGGIVVGELTYRLTRDRIEYEELTAIAVKGKDEPIPIWRAIAARSRFGVDIEPGTSTPLIGRDHELSLLGDLFQRVVREQSPHLVTLSGEPGVGKSRLTREFRTFIDDLPDLVSWRQGRCLPYGEGITFWALGEVVKSHAGILDNDAPHEAAEKLALAVEIVEDEREREWIRTRLGPLVGIGEETAAAEREESFAAWRSFLEAIAATGPFVLVIEDLHWADPPMLAFVEHLADWVTGVPLFVLCTARPELYEREPSWGGGKRNHTAVSLSPLSAEETAQLIAVLLDQTVLPAETQRTLLGRAGGNPLYAEEFIRMLVDRGVLIRRGGTWDLVAGEEDIPVPENVQALIAARLDTLPAERKALLQDAAVIGKVFWSGALATMGDRDEGAVREGMHELARKELVRPARRSSVEGQAEYSFWHLLIRDVAYSQIPRAARAEKHRAAAGWIEEIAGDRVADHAELLAFHHEEALRLSSAAGMTPSDEERVAVARFLKLAGDKTEPLDLARAIEYYERALAYLSHDPAGRARVLVQLCEAYGVAGRVDEAVRAGREAIELASAAGDRLTLGAAMAWLANMLHLRGEGTESWRLRAEAVSILEAEPPGPELVHAYEMFGGGLMLQDRNDEALPLFAKAIPLARRLGMDASAMILTQLRGTSRVKSGDRGGLQDLEAALHLGLERGIGHQTAVAYINYADCVWFNAGPIAGLKIHRTGYEFSTRRGVLGHATWSRAEQLWLLFDLGRWDELLEEAGRLIDQDDESGGSQVGTIARSFKAFVLCRRGKVGEAAGMVDAFLLPAKEVRDPQIMSPALLIAAEIRQAGGDPSGAAELLIELEAATRDQPFWTLLYLADITRTAAAAGDLAPAERLIEAARAGPDRHGHGLLSASAVRAEVSGDYDRAARAYMDAAAAWGDYGNVVEHAMANLGAGRALAPVGRTNAAEGPLRAARETFASIAATPFLAEVDELLDRGAALSS